MADISNIVLLRARAGKSDLLGQALAELVKSTRQEPGCAVSELNLSSSDPETWMVYERWRGQGAFDSHMQQPYVARFLAQLDELTREPPEVWPFQHRI